MTSTTSDPWQLMREAYDLREARAGDGAPGRPAAESAPVVDQEELSADLQAERAAIMEYDGGLTRSEAEALSAKRHGAASRPGSAG